MSLRSQPLCDLPCQTCWMQREAEPPSLAPEMRAGERAHRLCLQGSHIRHRGAYLLGPLGPSGLCDLVPCQSPASGFEGPDLAGNSQCNLENWSWSFSPRSSEEPGKCPSWTDVVISAGRGRSQAQGPREVRGLWTGSKEPSGPCSAPTLWVVGDTSVPSLSHSLAFPLRG